MWLSCKIKNKQDDVKVNNETNLKYLETFDDNLYFQNKLC